MCVVDFGRSWPFAPVATVAVEVCQGVLKGPSLLRKVASEAVDNARPHIACENTVTSGETEATASCPSPSPTLEEGS